MGVGGNSSRKCRPEVRYMTRLIYKIGKDQFGHEEEKSKVHLPPKSSRRQRQIPESFRRRKGATGRTENRAGEKLKILRRAENKSKRRKQRSRKRDQFIANPFQCRRQEIRQLE